MSEYISPCMQCGACCSYFRVSFYWAEADDGVGAVPVSLTEPISPFLRCMQGTNRKSPRCCALDGEIGIAVRCRIYANRPSTCHEFSPSGENSQINEACDRARAYYGLPALIATRVIKLKD
ncbi:YkgJ family cysteine cluster protein [Pectobacteriaceae bacterium C52]|uniref:YkgJ family cysteine cluster protein n=1 Tax=Brenneria uluponensis TaxID=3057057 RepID=UPI0028EB54CF|nr:YkgJ family cysteine cluster protein [Brenneria ulupoensis]WJV64511.1 YkgJ family cysteine cluster protein [Pectobacteriaceae bacterium C52]